MAERAGQRRVRSSSSMPVEKAAEVDEHAGEIGANRFQRRLDPAAGIESGVGEVARPRPVPSRPVAGNRAPVGGDARHEARSLVVGAEPLAGGEFGGVDRRRPSLPFRLTQQRQRALAEIDGDRPGRPFAEAVGEDCALLVLGGEAVIAGEPAPDEGASVQGNRQIAGRGLGEKAARLQFEREKGVDLRRPPGAGELPARRARLQMRAPPARR